MENEPVMLYPIKNQPGVYEGTLLFTPTHINKIQAWTPAGYRNVPLSCYKGIKVVQGRTLLMLQGEGLPFLDPLEIERPLGTPDSYPATQDGKRGLIHSETGLFLSRQLLLNYDCSEQDFHYNSLKSTIPSFKTKNRFETGEPVDIFVYGDSISAGSNASNLMGVPPSLPPYPDQIITYLKQKYPKGNIRLLNLSKGGESSRWGVKQLKNFIKLHPEFGFHLNIIAWGANDAGAKRPAQDYRKNIQHQLQILLHHNQTMECILVASSLPNKRWINARYELLQQYRLKLYEIANKYRNIVVVADLTDVWQKLLTRKDYYDLTGNGLNHPNDFGHRIYAQTITHLLSL
jgi:hypothetical protein